MKTAKNLTECCRGLLAACLSLMCFVGPVASAADDEWDFGAEIYLWGANIDIETATGGNSEIRFTDIADDLELAGMAVLAAQRGPWLFAADIVYLDIDDSIEDRVLPGTELSDLGLEAWIIQPKVGYRIQESQRSTVHLQAGLRYLWIDLDQKFEFSAPLPPGSSKFSESDGNWDGIVGVRGQWRFNDQWYTTVMFDVGAGDSDSTWQGLVDVGYRFKRFDVVAGYRYLDWSDTENDELNDLNISGFFAGAKFFF